MKLFFCHNTHIHQDIFKNTVATHKNMFPNSNFFLFSDGNTIYSNKEGEEVFNYGKKLGHKVGCITALFKTLKMSKEFSEKNNIVPDYIIFSHDDVFIKDKNLFLKTLSECKGDVLFREIISKKFYVPYRQYVAFDCIIFKPSIYDKINFEKLTISEDIKDLPKDRRQSFCPEISVGDIFEKFKVESNSLKVSTIIQGSLNEFGFYHIRKPRVN